MEILRVFNNNVVLAKDTTGEVIVTGRGLGFQAKPGDVVDPAKIVRVFVPADGRDPDHLAELLADIPIEYIQLVANAATAAGLSDSLMQSPTLIMALADHVKFAIRRAKTGRGFEYPLLAEVRHLYDAEYLQAVAILRHINSRLSERGEVTLPDSEAVALTLHLVNAGFASGDLSYTYQMTGVLQQLIDVVENTYGVVLRPDTANIGRFITHLRYLFVRIRQHKQLVEGHSSIADAIMASDPKAYDCALKLSSIVELRLDASLTADEIAYLTLHISRITSAISEDNLYERKESQMISRTATIGSSVGLHARPAAIFTQAAGEYDYDITISFDGEEADAASILEVMTLGAKHGDEVTLSSDEDEAAEALDALAELLARDLENE